MTCANCGGDYDVAPCTPDLDIRPVPLCGLCRFNLDWRIELKLPATPERKEESPT